MQLRKRNVVSWLTALFWGLELLGTCAESHPSVGHILQRVSLTLGDDYLDITFDVRFSGVASLEERHEMDRDDDGNISPVEISAYLRRRSDAISEELNLWLNDRRLTLEPWLKPVCDPPDMNPGSAGPLRCRFHYVAPFDWTQPGLQELRIRYDCFKESPGLLQFLIGRSESVRVCKTSLDAYTPFRTLSNERQLVVWFESDPSPRKRNVSGWMVSSCIVLAPQQELPAIRKHP